MREERWNPSGTHTHIELQTRPTRLPLTGFTFLWADRGIHIPMTNEILMPGRTGAGDFFRVIFAQPETLDRRCHIFLRFPSTNPSRHHLLWWRGWVTFQSAPTEGSYIPYRSVIKRPLGLRQFRIKRNQLKRVLGALLRLEIFDASPVFADEIRGCFRTRRDAVEGYRIATVKSG